MKRIVRGVCGLLSAVMLLSATAMAADYTPVAASDARVEGFYNGEGTSLQMELAGRYNSGAMSEDGGSLEIVQYNAQNGFAYAVSGVLGKLIAIDLNGDMSGSIAAKLEGSQIDIAQMVNTESFLYGDMTSVAVSPDGRMLAVAIQAKDYDKAGAVAVFICKKDGTLELVKTVSVGVQPDMVTFTPDGSKILTADEGEPRMGYSAEGAVDPKGSVSIIDTKTFAVETVGFDAFDSDAARQALVDKGIVLKKGTGPSVDLEPEYIACTDDTAYVTCQEANAIAVLDLEKGELANIYSVGFEDYSEVAIDINKKDEEYAPKTYECLRGIRMPDGISLYETGGDTYLLTANEGDARAWPVETEEDSNEDERNFGKGKKSTSKKITAENSGLKGKVVFFDSKDYDGLDTDKDYLFGGRSFTVLKVTEDGLEEVFVSGSDFERITNEKLADYFNCSNNNVDVEDRSGKKGPEPESVIVGTVGSKTYAFIALERIGGIMVYDITDPGNTTFVNYINSRDFTEKIRGDVSPEGLCFILAAQSTTGKPLLLAACEVSGTLAVYELTGEQDDAPDIPSAPGIDPILAALLTSGNQQRFVDVASNAYCYDAVNWAVGKEITSGVSKDAFAPERSCTRADFVTFLWRAAGKPVVNFAMNFSDVKEDVYYAEAVRWAASLGIVTGLSKNNFGAANAVTREQVVTMLWRFAKQQGFDTTQGGMAIREYDDYDSLSEYAREAMAWAVNAEILKGSNNRLLPDASCTRAQLVTLLYRLETQTANQVDYSGDVTGWMYMPESRDTATDLLVSIDTVASGSAGGSLQRANAAVSLMKLAMDESRTVEDAVKAYLARMNATQKDFFSFQWQQALSLASALLDGSEDPAILDDAGDDGFDLKAVSSAKVDALDKTVTKLLLGAGVTDEWKNHTDLEPFNAAA